MLQFPLSRLCFEGPDAELKLTENTQPALVAVSTAAWRVATEEGLRPDYVAGHSLGEYSALVAAGALRLPTPFAWCANGDAICRKLCAGSGRDGRDPETPGRKLDAVLAEASQGEVVTAANYNSPDQIVIAGHAGAVERAMALAKAAGAKRTVPLPVSAPFHCPLMKPAQERMKSIWMPRNFATSRSR